MNEDRIIHAKFEIKLESIEWDLKGWLKTLLPQQITKPLIKIGKPPETCSIKRDLLARHSPFLDKQGY